MLVTKTKMAWQRTLVIIFSVGIFSLLYFVQFHTNTMEITALLQNSNNDNTPKDDESEINAVNNYLAREVEQIQNEDFLDSKTAEYQESKKAESDSFKQGDHLDVSNTGNDSVKGESPEDRTAIQNNNSKAENTVKDTTVQEGNIDDSDSTDEIIHSETTENGDPGSQNSNQVDTSAKCNDANSDWKIINKSDCSKESQVKPSQNTTPSRSRLKLTGVPLSIGLGNQLFLFASMVGIAARNDMQVVLPYELKALEEAFPDLKQWPHLTPGTKQYYKSFVKSTEVMYDNRTENFKNGGVNVSINGFYHSFKFFAGYEDLVRKYIQFAPEVRHKVDLFLQNITYSNWTECNYTRVGIHIRRGDYLKPLEQSRGFVVAPPEYVAHAMDYFNQRYRNIQYIVAGNGMDWAMENVKGKNVIFSQGLSPPEDMEMLGRCDHIIYTTGSFGWWSAWRANGTTIFFDHPHHTPKGSTLFQDYKKEDAVYPQWIPMK